MSEMETIEDVIKTIDIQNLSQADFMSIVGEIFQAFAEREHEHKLALWLEDQRQAYKDGLLSAEQIAQLESLPNFSWETP